MDLLKKIMRKLETYIFDLVLSDSAFEQKETVKVEMSARDPLSWPKP